MNQNLIQQGISCGHTEVAKAASSVLQEGGNAADAAIAAALCSCVAEPVLASLGGGGLGLIWQPDGTIQSVDFWIAPPAHYDKSAKLDTVVLDWPGGIKQPFAVGAGSVGVWGMPNGLETILQDYGTISTAEAARYAIELSQRPPILNSSQAEWMSLLHGVHTAFGEFSNSIPQKGQDFTWPGLTKSLERFASQGAGEFYTGPWAHKALATLGGRGPSAHDLESYQTRISSSRETQVGDIKLFLPEMSLTAELLSMLLPPKGREKHDVDLSIMQNLQDFTQSSLTKRRQSGPSTTSIIVKDGSGMGVALVLSNGSGSGIFNNGVQLNNVGGEIDLLNSADWNKDQGRFPTRMCPMVARSAKQWLILGSGGSERITAATLQVLYYNMWAGISLADSIASPRMYAEAESIQVEPRSPFPGMLTNGIAVHTWDSIHQYFGGVNAIGQKSGHALEACSDPRRQGKSEVLQS